MQTPRQSAFTAGQRLGSYTLLEPMGAGGLGEVWKARDRRLNRVVALKFISAEAQAASPARELLREARAASALNHPNIVTVFEVGEGDSGAFLAMEFVEGQTLRTRMKQPPVPLDEALNVAEQVLAGLAAAHRQGIVHRDMKPENIMLRVDGYVKVLDFGLAKVLPWAQSETGDSTAVSTPSRSGQLVGTFSYMSPEQARGHAATPASDVFSFGIVLYELITSEHPFRGETTMDTLTAILHKEAPPASERSGSVSKELSGVIARALCKEPSGRFPTAAEMAAELRRAREHVQAQPAAPPVHARSRLAQVIGVVLLLVLLAATAIYMRPRAGVGPEAAPTVSSVAIMAFGADDPASQALAQGLPDELGTALAGSGMAVAPRATSRGLATTSDARTIGLQLGVDTILEGSVRSYGSKLKVHAELVSVRTGFQVWSGSVTVDAADALAAEQQAARDIARQLHEALMRER